MAHTICTFNVNNLYVRYKFGQTFPGDMSEKSLVEDPQFGYLPIYKPELFDLFNPTQRELAGRAITNDKQDFPDVICLQEVESLLALRRFNEEHLGEKYNYAILIDSRDFRQIDVGILSRLKIVNIRTHIDDIDPSPASPGPPKPPEKPRLFSRDCLEVEIALNGSGSKRLTLFINHLKSKLASTPAERQRADELRKRQAEAVKKTIESRFPGEQFNQEFFAALKPGAYFVSVGRGRSTVTADLIAALKSGRLAGAGLDVVDPEPLPPDSPLWHAPNLIITPHVSADTPFADEQRNAVLVENLRRYAAGEPMLSVVDVERGY